jgi:hypothetical protein
LVAPLTWHNLIGWRRRGALHDDLSIYLGKREKKRQKQNRNSLLMKMSWFPQRHNNKYVFHWVYTGVSIRGIIRPELDVRTPYVTMHRRTYVQE